jgi:hypothetical protein
MISAPLTKKIVQAFDALSGQLQSAARFVLDHPHDVALKSMRDQARAANVKPATMTRLAQRDPDDAPAGLFGSRDRHDHGGDAEAAAYFCLSGSM